MKPGQSFVVRMTHEPLFPERLFLKQVSPITYVGWGSSAKALTAFKKEKFSLKYFKK
jgi:hypothetical protein